MPARQGKGGVGAGPALLQAESLLLFESHPNLHLPTLGREGPYQGRCIFPQGTIPKTKRDLKPVGAESRGDALSAAPLGPGNLGEARIPPPFTLLVLVCAGMPGFSKCQSDWHFLNMNSDVVIRNQASGFAGSRTAGSPGARLGRRPPCARVKPPHLPPGLPCFGNGSVHSQGSHFPICTSGTGVKKKDKTPLATSFSARRPTTQPW